MTEIARKQEEKCLAPVIRVGWLEFNVPCQHEYGYIRDDCSSSTAVDFLYDVHNLIIITDLYSRVQDTGHRQRFHATNPTNLSANWRGIRVAGFHSRMNSLQQRQRCTKLSLQVSPHYLATVKTRHADDRICDQTPFRLAVNYAHKQANLTDKTKTSQPTHTATVVRKQM